MLVLNALKKGRKLLAGWIVLSLIFSYSCGKIGKVAWVYYDETHCDAWEYSINNEVLKERVVSYLKGKGVKVYEIEIFQNGPADGCFECSCKTGRRLKAKVRERDLSEAKAENFYQ